MKLIKIKYRLLTAGMPEMDGYVALALTPLSIGLQLFDKNEKLFLTFTLDAESKKDFEGKLVSFAMEKGASAILSKILSK